mmetsp:Transcript_16766/g.43303  ORF Transcript_16766/g.43303 Transcript_16766/m.43303 type:complete len:209 (+) Transcript_16766:783-1409(+)
MASVWPHICTCGGASRMGFLSATTVPPLWMSRAASKPAVRKTWAKHSVASLDAAQPARSHGTCTSWRSKKPSTAREGWALGARARLRCTTASCTRPASPRAETKRKSPCSRRSSDTVQRRGCAFEAGKQTSTLARLPHEGAQPRGSPDVLSPPSGVLRGRRRTCETSTSASQDSSSASKVTTTAPPTWPGAARSLKRPASQVCGSLRD